MFPDEYFEDDCNCQEENDDLLSVDLNDIIGKQVKERIESLKSEIDDLKGQLVQKSADLNTTKAELKNLTEKSEKVLLLDNFLIKIRDKYNDLKHDKENNISVKEQRFYIISDILKSFYKVSPKKFVGGSLYKNLAVLYPGQKDIIIDILSILEGKNSYGRNFVEKFVLPANWDKQKILSFISKPHTCTNGYYDAITSYWLDIHSSSDSITNTPYSEIFKNPLFVEDEEVFEYLISRIKLSKHHYNFFLISKYQKLTDEQIKSLGNCLSYIPPFSLKTEKFIMDFMKNNLSKFSKGTLDYLFSKIENEESSLVPPWNKFPIEYQVKKLKGSSFSDVHRFVRYKDNIEEIERLLRLWFKENN